MVGPSNATITMNEASFENDMKSVGHQFAHYCAFECGFLVSPGGDHFWNNNQRLSPNPSPTSDLTVGDQNLTFQEGYADWFAVSGAYHTDMVTGSNGQSASFLAAFPGFGTTSLTCYHGMWLGQAGGGGEDTDASVAKILWKLEKDPLFAANASGLSEKQVFQLAGHSAGTLYGLWLETSMWMAPDQDTVNRLATIFEQMGVAPVPDSRVCNGGRRHIHLHLAPPETANATTAPFTFDSLTLTLTGKEGGDALTQTFVIGNIASPLTRPNLQTLGLSRGDHQLGRAARIGGPRFK